MKIIRNIAIVLAAVLFLAALAALIALKAIDFNEYKPAISRAVQRATGRELMINGRVNLHASLTPSLVVHNITFANAEWSDKKKMMSLKRLRARMALMPLLRGDIQIETIILDEPRILLETNEAGHNNWLFKTSVNHEAKDTDAHKTAGTPPSLPLVKQIKINNGTVVYNDRKEDRIFTLDIESVAVLAKATDNPLRLSMKFSVNDKPVSIEGRLGSVADLLADREFALDLNIEAGKGSLQLQGRIKSPQRGKDIDLKVDMQGDNLADLAALAGTELPEIGPYSLTAKFYDSDDGYALDDLAAKLGNSDVSGKANFILTEDRPKFSAELEADLIDEGGLWPVPEKIDGAGNASESARQDQPDKIFSDTQLPFDGLHAADISCRLKCRQLLFKQTSINNLVLNLSLYNGNLRLNPLSFQTADGSIHIEADLINDATPVVQLQSTAQGINLGRLLTTMKVTDLLENGALDVRLDLSSKGTSIAALMANLDGHVFGSLSDGRITNSAIDLAGADLFTELFESLNPFTRKDEYTLVNCAAINFKFNKGIAENKTGLGVETEKMNVSGGGIIDLREESLDMAVKPKPRKGIGISVGSLADLVRIKGPLNDPRPSADTMGVAKKAASIGLAITTGGASLLGEALFGKITADSSPCKTALESQ